MKNVMQIYWNWYVIGISYLLLDGTNYSLSKKAKDQILQHIKTQRAKDLVMESLVTFDALKKKDSKFSKDEKYLVQSKCL